MVHVPNYILPKRFGDYIISKIIRKMHQHIVTGGPCTQDIYKLFLLAPSKSRIGWSISWDKDILLFDRKRVLVWVTDV